VTDLQTPWIPILQSAYSTSQWRTATPQNIMRCVQQENLSYVLVQGAPFPHLPSFLLSFKVLWSFPLGDPPIVPTPWYSLTIPHIRAGGVLTGVWFFGSNTPFHQSSLRARPKQRLRHIIHTAFRGVRLREAPPPCQEHDMQEDEVIRWSGINTLDWDSCPIPVGPLSVYLHEVMVDRLTIDKQGTRVRL